MSSVSAVYLIKQVLGKDFNDWITNGIIEDNDMAGMTREQQAQNKIRNDKILELYNSGLSLAEIATEINLTKKNVSTILWRMGVRIPRPTVAPKTVSQRSKVKQAPRSQPKSKNAPEAPLRPSNDQLIKPAPTVSMKQLLKDVITRLTTLLEIME